MGLLTNATETFTKKKKISIGTDGAEMEIKVQKNADGTFINGPVVKNEKRVALLVQQWDGQVILSVMKDAQLSTEEMADLFAKSAAIVDEANALASQD